MSIMTIIYVVIKPNMSVQVTAGPWRFVRLCKIANSPYLLKLVEALATPDFYVMQEDLKCQKDTLRI